MTTVSAFAHAVDVTPLVAPPAYCRCGALFEPGAFCTPAECDRERAASESEWRRRADRSPFTPAAAPVQWHIYAGGELVTTVTGAAQAALYVLPGRKVTVRPAGGAR